MKTLIETSKRTLLLAQLELVSNSSLNLQAGLPATEKYTDIHNLKGMGSGKR